MTDLRPLTLLGARKALEIRQRLQIDKSAPAIPFEIAPQLGAQVWLRDASTFDGVYSAGAPPAIVISSLRPLGRTAFTCAHEIAHHAFGHGARIDEVLDPDATNSQLAPEEHIANAFAAHLLMPRSAVIHGMQARQLDPRAITPVDVLALSSWLGVGYATLVTHLCYQLRLLGGVDVSRLNSHEPNRTKVAIAPDCHGTQEVVLADQAWSGRPIECRVDDFVCLPRDTEVDGARLTLTYRGSHGDVFRAMSVGQTICSLKGGWTCPARVWRRGKAGRALYIYDEEDGDE
jgi:hypothetical protein